MNKMDLVFGIKTINTKLIKLVFLIKLFSISHIAVWKKLYFLYIFQNMIF